METKTGDIVECISTEGFSQDSKNYLLEVGIKVGDKLIVGYIEEYSSKLVAYRFINPSDFLHPSTSFKKIELVGIKFKVNIDPTEYLISSEEKGIFTVSWKTPYSGKTTYNKETILKHFNAGNWVEIKTQNMKEIIGYKLSKPEYFKAASEIADDTEQWNSNLQRDGWMFSNDCFNQNALKEAGVLDLWFKPVYKSEEVVIELGAPLRKFTISKNLIVMVDGDGQKREFTQTDVDNIRKLFSTKEFKTFIYYPKEIQFGCSSGTSLTEKDVITLQTKQAEL